MGFDVAAAKRDGWTDQEIADYLATKDQPLPPEQPRDRSEERSAVTTAVIPSVMQSGGNAAMDIVKYTLGGAGAYAGGKYLYDKYLRPNAQAQRVAQSQALSQAQSQAQNAAAEATGTNGGSRVTGTGTGTGTGDNRINFDTGRPLETPPPPPQQPGIIQRGMDYARQMRSIAADKVVQAAQATGEGLANAGRAVAPYAQAAGRAAAPYAAPVAVGLTAALMPGNAGGAQMMVPQTGRLRGSDLNPVTGRPWTRQELDAYNANPNILDSRLPR